MSPLLAAPPNDGVAFQKITSGRNYTPPGLASTSSTTNNRCAVGLLILDEATTFDNLYFEVTSNAAAGGVMHLGIWEALASGLPGALLLDAGTAGTTTNGVKTIAPGNFTLPPGWYWVGGQSEVATCTVRVLQTNGGAPALNGGLVSTVLGATGGVLWTDSGGTTLLDPFGAPSAGLVHAVKVGLRAT